MNQEGCCELCALYAWDEEYGYYVCEADLDEDDMERFLRGQHLRLPLFSAGRRVPRRPEADVGEAVSCSENVTPISL